MLQAWLFAVYNRGGTVISLYARVASCAGIPDSQSRASLPDTRFASLVRERICPGKPDLERGVISRRTLEAPKLLAKVCVCVRYGEG